MIPTVPRVAMLGCDRSDKHYDRFTQTDHFVFARYALVEAFKRTGICPGRMVLLPSYHCRTIVESALFLGADVCFYPMTEDLRPDFLALRGLILGKSVKALLLTHYFGFPNALHEARSFCSEHGIALIEDCAHAFYGEHLGQALGTVGDYSIASAWKFLPVRGGAVLRDNIGTAQASALTLQPWVSEFKAVAGIVEAQLRRKSLLPEIYADNIVNRALEIASAPPSKVVTQGDPESFRPDLVNVAGLRASRWLTAQYPHEYSITQRRKNYLRWLDGVAGMPGIEPLFPSLPNGVVPYAFPLLTDTKGLAFHALRLAGFPIWRWEDMAVNAVEICPVTADYRLRLLQLPCHQDLTEQDMDWMIDVVQRVLPRVLV